MGYNRGEAIGYKEKSLLNLFSFSSSKYSNKLIVFNVGRALPAKIPLKTEAWQ